MSLLKEYSEQDVRELVGLLSVTPDPVLPDDMRDLRDHFREHPTDSVEWYLNQYTTGFTPNFTKKLSVVADETLATLEGVVRYLKDDGNNPSTALREGMTDEELSEAIAHNNDLSTQVSQLAESMSLLKVFWSSFDKTMAVTTQKILGTKDWRLFADQKYSRTIDYLTAVIEMLDKRQKDFTSARASFRQFIDVSRSDQFPAKFNRPSGNRLPT